MSAKADIPLHKLISSIVRHRGSVTAVANEFKCRRRTIYSHIEASPLAKEAFEDARESLIDDVEHALYQSALNGSVVAQMFILRSHPTARRRGWGEPPSEMRAGLFGSPVVNLEQGGGEVLRALQAGELSEDDLRRDIRAFANAAILVADAGRADSQVGLGSAQVGDQNP